MKQKSIRMSMVDLEIHNDAKEALEYLIPLVNQKSYETWIQGIQDS